ncbi:MAG: hypothetical protein K8R16_02910 [Anaerolineales bacterium]|nr:hypothetical protein [Anaerolineales bacterium]
MYWKNKIGKLFFSLFIIVIGILPVRGSEVDLSQQLEQIRSYSRPYEFDYASWIVSALGQKLTQSSLKVYRYTPAGEERQIVLDYLDLRNQINQSQNILISVLSDPQLENRDQASAEIKKELEEMRSRREDTAPFVEQIIQSQMNHALVNLGMSAGGQLVPPVLYRSEPDSYALIVSPRDEIQQAANLMLIRNLTLEQIIHLEEIIERELNLSALVVGIGGVGLYPSMVIETGNLDWLIHVIGHEWTHNFLTIRPLGANYFTSPELTTINETIADLSADEIQRETFLLYYPEFLPAESVAEEPEETPPPDPIPAGDVFDFRAEMHITRLEVDRLLAEGDINKAEDYMETRRLFFLENGYLIRRLNQAYFAFHGSYAAAPGGAADAEGADLGSQLRELKTNASSYAAFMHEVAWKWRLDQFQRLFEENN